MKQYFEAIMNWSELWVLIIPLFAILRTQRQPAFMFPTIVYIWVAFWFNGLIEIVSVLFYSVSISHKNILHGLLQIPGFNNFYDTLEPAHKTNTLFYNCHSLGRFICFAVFFISLKNTPFKRLYYWLIGFFTLSFMLYFNFIDSFFNPKYISSDLMAGEAFILLCFCMLYYLTILREPPQSFWARKDFWVVTGLCFFSAINFFLFLFYHPLLNESKENAINIWDFFNISFIIFILFLTKSFYVPSSDKL